MGIINFSRESIPMSQGCAYPARQKAPLRSESCTNRMYPFVWESTNE
jgi:hypothetical protein